MPDYSSFSTPHLSRDKISQEVADFRRKYWKDKTSPVKMMDMLEFDLKIKIMPALDLEYICGTDCFITSDWSHLFIDKKQYEDIYERWDKRINFSIAHEIGHLVLHKQLYENLKIREVADLIQFLEQCPPEQYDSLEKQANAFAGRLLVPREELIIATKDLLGGKVKERVDLALQDRFGVSNHVLIIRIQVEKIELDSSLLGLF